MIDPKEKIQYFENTRKAIPSILYEFKRNDVHATWAIVGMLFNRNWREWEKNIPKELPKYIRTELSAYGFGNKIKSQGVEDLVFAPEIIKKIRDLKGQEIATHTYSHYYCMEEGQKPKDFREDLRKAIEVAFKMGIELRSLVFPRNQLKQDYLKICSELGIENVRSNPSSWYWRDTQSEAILTKVARSGDAYLPLGNKTYALREMEVKEGLPLEQKASRFLRPVEESKFFRKLKLRRIKEEMTEAARKGEVYHLWWHPHNFGDKPEESLQDLRNILSHFKACQKKYVFQSLNMKEINQLKNSLK